MSVASSSVIAAGRVLRDRSADVLCVLAALAYGGFVVGVGDASGPDPALPLRLDVGIGLACSPVLFWRRRRPLGVALALLPASAVSIMSTGPLVAAVFSLAVHRRGPSAALMGVGFVATAPIYVLLQGTPRYPLWADLLVRTLVAAAAVGWGMFIRARRQLLASLAERAARAEREQQFQVEQARRAERDRIAREMHDVLAHRLSLVSLHAGALELLDGVGEQVTTSAAVIRTAAHQALEELREVIGLLREGPSGAPEQPQPGLAELRDLIEDAKAIGGRVDYADRLDGSAVPPPHVGRTAYRLVQEGLTNARKHAPGTVVQVLVAGRAGGGLQVRITNPRPVTTARNEVPGSGIGLIGLRERVTLSGGRLEHGWTGPDFRLEAWLPWPA